MCVRVVSSSSSSSSECGFINAFKYNRRILYKKQTNKMENGRMMILHSAIIGSILYLFMFYVLRQRSAVAENRSIVLAALVLIYMVVFGHGLPTSINKDLM